MKLAMIIFLAVFVGGCSMDHKDVITAVKECESAGMVGRPMSNGLGAIIEVQCWPKDKP